MGERICAINDCGRPVYGHGWCSMHYTRHRRYGDPLTLVRDKSRSPAAKFAAQVEPVGGCLLWTGAVDHSGYGRFGRSFTAHRFAYEMANGPVPQGLILDHLCHNADASCVGGAACAHRRCVNPTHLEAVPQAVNTRRGIGGVRAAERAAAKTHCKHGHEFTAENTRLVASRSGRLVKQCRACHRERSRQRRQKGGADMAQHCHEEHARLAD